MAIKRTLNYVRSLKTHRVVPSCHALGVLEVVFLLTFSHSDQLKEELVAMVNTILLNVGMIDSFLVHGQNRRNIKMSQLQYHQQLLLCRRNRPISHHPLYLFRVPRSWFLLAVPTPTVHTERINVIAVAIIVL